VPLRPVVMLWLAVLHAFEMRGYKWSFDYSIPALPAVGLSRLPERGRCKGLRQRQDFKGMCDRLTVHTSKAVGERHRLADF
jgi:hypothetical protein